MSKQLTSTIVGLVCTIWFANTAEAQKVYWTDVTAHLVQRADLDGEGGEVLIAESTTVNPVSVAVDASAGKIYWTDMALRGVYRANLDGTQREDLTVHGFIGDFIGIALDVAGGKMYVTDGAMMNQNTIWRADLDGTDSEVLISGLPGVAQIALDISGGKMYWTNAANGGQIRRANLDGSNVENLFDFVASNPAYINLDLANGKMYWLDYGQDLIRRSDLDGSNLENLVTLLSHADGYTARGLALDINAGHLYWTDHGHLMRSSLNGADSENLGDIGLPFVGGIHFDSANTKLYWSQAAGIRRADAGWENMETIITGTLVNPRAIEHDPLTNQFYWASNSPDGDWIFTADQDGNNAQQIISIPGGYVSDIAISQSLSKLYWVDNEGSKIQRANLDGTGVEDVLLVTVDETSGITSNVPFGIAIDDTAGKMYFTSYEQLDGLGGFIRRANLDGSSVEVVYFDMMFSPFGIAIDEVSSKLYITDAEPTRRIVRMDLDGSNFEVLVTQTGGLIAPRDIALDMGNGKIYWADGARIARANLDGSNVESPITGLNAAHGLALDLFCDLQIYCDVNASGSMPNIDDILCTLRGFANAADCPGADVKPCEANGTINLDDILSVVAAFGGDNACPDKCE